MLVMVEELWLCLEAWWCWEDMLERTEQEHQCSSGEWATARDGQESVLSWYMFEQAGVRPPFLGEMQSDRVKWIMIS